MANTGKGFARVVQSSFIQVPFIKVFRFYILRGYVILAKYFEKFRVHLLNLVHKLHLVASLEQTNYKYWSVNIFVDV